MPDAYETTIAKAVEAELTAASTNGTFGRTFAVERTYVPVYDLKAETGTKVFVVHTDMASDQKKGTRDEDFETYSIQVGVFRKVDDPADTAACDAAAYFTSKVRDHFRAKREEGELDLRTVRHDRAFEGQKLVEENTFVSVITLTFATLR